MHDYDVGDTVFIKTFGEYYTGRVSEIHESEIVLVESAWIASTGRFADAMKTGEFDEVEPYPDDFRLAIPRGAIMSGVSNWPHPLPREQQ